ncbi:hypothetical protein [Paraclostridium sordellii]|uniref:phage lytic cycle repressor MrpR family protein n=1 Tax=Paraclostridium sordellii TaxID=1505 RepID=UPI0022DE9E44|nr:hypothetical protein [Paeniclostridium sordellii]
MENVMEQIKEQIEDVTNMIENDDYIYTKKELNLRTLKEYKTYLLETGKRFEDLEKEDIINLAKRLKSSSYTYLNIQVDSLNHILKYVNREDILLNVNGIHKSHDRENKDFDIKEHIQDTSDRYYTKREIQDICDLFINPVDKFIVYGLFCGIDGKGRSELLNLKKDQINFENKTITLSDRIIYIDDYMEDILKDTLNPVFGSRYYKYLDDKVEGSTSESYDLNFDSEYVIKTKPYSKNNYGLNPMKISGFNQRMKTLNDYLEDFKLVPRDIVRSGVIDKMYKIKKSGWTQGQVQEFLKQNNIKMQSFELKRIFELKYNK